MEVLAHGLHNILRSKNCDNIFDTPDTVYSEVEYGILEGPPSVRLAKNVLVYHIVFVAIWKQSTA